MNAYDVASGRLLWHAPQAGGLDVREGVVAASAVDGSRVRILDGSTGRTMRTLVSNQGAAGDLAFSPNGALLAAHVGDGTVTVWNAVTGRIEHSLRTGAQGGIAYSAYSDTLFTGGNRLGSLLAWDLQGRRSFLTRIAVDGFRPLADGTVRVSQTGSWVSMSGTIRGSAELRLGRPRPDSEVQVIVPGAGWRGVGAWSPDSSRYVYADRAGFLSVVNPADGSHLRRRQIASRPILGITYAGSAQVLALVEGNQLVVADANTLNVEARVGLTAVATGLTATSSVAVVTSAAAEGDASWRVPIDELAPRWHPGGSRRRPRRGRGRQRVRNVAVARRDPRRLRRRGGRRGDRRRAERSRGRQHGAGVGRAGHRSGVVTGRRPAGGKHRVRSAPVGRTPRDRDRSGQLARW